MDTPACGPTLYPVVVIDDDPDDLFFITRRINKAGVRNAIMSFSDGADAVRHFTTAAESMRSQPPACLVFCDIKMPRMDGFQVLRWFRAQAKLAPIPFVMLSGSNEHVDRQLARELGANDYLVKFPTAERLAEVIVAANASVVGAFQ